MLQWTEVVEETPLARAIRLIDIGAHNLCEYDRQEETWCDETPGLGVTEWCDACRIREALTILRSLSEPHRASSPGD